MKGTHVIAGMLLVLAVAGRTAAAQAPVPEELPQPAVEAQPSAQTTAPAIAMRDYRIGADDVLEVTVMDAPEMSRTLRVTASGEISLPPLGVIPVAGMTTREMELTLEKRLFETYMLDPHVSVQVTEMHSHAISVMGAVTHPGVFQITGPRTLHEVLSMAGGLTAMAGDTVTILRGGALPGSEASAGIEPVSLQPGAAAEGMVEVNLQEVKGPGQGQPHLLIHPGDKVHVEEAGLLYIVGEVNKPGAFPLADHEQMSILRAVALSEGTTRVASKKHTRIVRTLPDGSRTEIEVDLNRVMQGKDPDVTLQAQDVLFVPNSAGRTLALGAVDTLVRMVMFRP